LEPGKTIFVQIGDHNLKTRIETWALDRKLELFTGKGCDLIAVGYLFAIVERQEVGEKVWNNYLDYLRESEVHTPCVILNTNRNKAKEGFSGFKFAPEIYFSDLTCFLDGLLQESLIIP
jgi:hypothetical protein